MVAFLLIRHAQSTWNAGGRWQGQADPPLSDSGEMSANEAATHLRADRPFDLVITSDLARARRTGEILGSPSGLRRPALGGAESRTGSGGEDLAKAPLPRLRPSLVLEPALREFHVGAWSGLTRSEIEKRWPNELEMFDAGQLPSPPGGESRDEFDSRVRDAARRVAAHIHRHGARRTLIVTHGGVIRSILRSSGRPERHVTNLAGYEGHASPEGLLLGGPVDLLQPSRTSRSDGAAIL